jgi:nitroreductase/molybdopterin/thiamine biosynthesis adenylyltransferase
MNTNYGKILELLNNGTNLVHENNKIYKAIFFRLTNSEEQQSMFELLQLHKHLKVYDHIWEQLVDLVKVLNPSKKLSSEELKHAIHEHLNGKTLEQYGVWVYYPWSDRLVHMLDEQEFIEVRTSRNKNKITNEERDILSRKIIGVIGLSVGQSVSVTLAQERICGELRLADFDLLELTNLNRIRTGVHNLGLAKVYSVAREIAEIDPFIKVRCFPEGIIEANMHSFFMEHGKMSLLVEESDGFDIKIMARYKARELGIPVIMEASDRCMVDVERFDLEPDREILHGIVKHLDIPTLKSLTTTEEKIPYMLDVLGLDTSSVRLKASMLEIDQTINTWPQLASAVTMGGGITADVSRRILLDLFKSSGRYYVDIDELIGDKQSVPTLLEDFSFPALSIEKCNELISRIQIEDGAERIDQTLLEEILNDAIKAPSAGNNQPWKWLFKQNHVYLFHDKARSYGWTDLTDSLAYMGLGSALENLRLSAAKHGFIASIQYFPLQTEKLLIASVRFNKLQSAPSLLDLELYKAIGVRCSNRKKGQIESIPPEKLAFIRSSIDNRFKIDIIEDQAQIKEMASIVSSIEKLRFMHPEGHYEFFEKELRWTDKEVKHTKDGLDIETLELTNLNKTGLKMSANAEVMKKLVDWNGGGGLMKISKEIIETSSAVCLLRAVNLNELNMLEKGMAMQRVWLAANQVGISFHPISSPIFFFERIKMLNDLPSKMTKQIEEQQIFFDKIFDKDENFSNVFLFRLAISEEPTTVALRRDLKDCFDLID